MVLAMSSLVILIVTLNTVVFQVRWCFNSSASSRAVKLCLLFVWLSWVFLPWFLFNDSLCFFVLSMCFCPGVSFASFGFVSLGSVVPLISWVLFYGCLFCGTLSCPPVSLWLLSAWSLRRLRLSFSWCFASICIICGCIHSFKCGSNLSSAASVFVSIFCVKPVWPCNNWMFNLGFDPL